MRIIGARRLRSRKRASTLSSSARLRYESSRVSPSLPAPLALDERLYTRHFWTASASHFLLGMGFWMFVVFPLHLQNLGASTARIGVLIALEPTAAVLVRPGLGGLMVRRGRRWILRTGGFLNLVAVSLYAVVEDIGWGMTAIRILHGIGIGAMFLCATAGVAATLIGWVVTALCEGIW